MPNLTVAESSKWLKSQLIGEALEKKAIKALNSSTLGEGVSLAALGCYEQRTKSLC